MRRRRRSRPRSRASIPRRDPTARAGQTPLPFHVWRLIASFPDRTVSWSVSGTDEWKDPGRNVFADTYFAGVLWTRSRIGRFALSRPVRASSAAGRR